MKPTNKDGGPAFPQSYAQTKVSGSFSSLENGEGGMTLRDYFAAAALQGTLTSMVNEDIFNAIRKDAADSKVSPAITIAQLAYGAADAMLRARGK